MDGEVRVLRDLDEVVALVGGTPLYLRYSSDPRAEATSVDYESGLELPGLSVNPLHPEAWWTRPPCEWLSRQICRYVFLREDAPDERRAWVLAGRVAARGPDNEPLLVDVQVVGVLDDAVVEQAKRVYADRFDVGRNSTNTPREAVP